MHATDRCETERFAKCSGKDGDQSLATAAETIRKLTGKQIDFATVARNDGAEVAVNPLLHAARLAKHSNRWG